MVDDYKLGVVVDGSPNSLDETICEQNESVVDIKPMDMKMIWQIEQLQDLFKYVKEADLDAKNFGAMPNLTYRMANHRDKLLVIICALKSLLLSNLSRIQNQKQTIWKKLSNCLTRKRGGFLVTL